MMAVYPTPYQTTQGARPVAKPSAQPLRPGVQRNQSAFALNARRDSGDLANIHPVLPAQRGIAGEKTDSCCGIFLNQPVKNRTSVFGIQKNRSGAEIRGVKRAHAYGFSVADGRIHAGSAGFKANRCVLPQEFNHCSGSIDRADFFWRESVRHPDHFYTGKAQKR